MSPWPEIRAWIARAFLIIAFIFTLCILKRNYSNKNKSNESLSRYLNIWSSITLILSPFCVLIFISVYTPIICPYSSQILVFALISPKILLSFYQLSRLQSSFSISHGSIPKTMAYPKCLFIILYIIGILMLIESILFFLITNTPIYPKGNGCDWDSNFLSFSIGITSTLIYLLWDWIIVGLYIYKMYQLKQSIGIHRNNNKTLQILEKINLILNKIIFLTFIEELIGLIIIFTSLYSKPGGIGWSIDIIAISYTMYLMLEHNSKDYGKLLLFFNKIRCIKYCCCCFKRLVVTKQDNADNTAHIIDIDDDDTTNATDGQHIDDHHDHIEQGNIFEIKMEYIDNTESTDNITTVAKLKNYDGSQRTET